MVERWLVEPKVAGSIPVAPAYILLYTVTKVI